MSDDGVEKKGKGSSESGMIGLSDDEGGVTKTDLPKGAAVENPVITPIEPLSGQTEAAALDQGLDAHGDTPKQDIIEGAQPSQRMDSAIDDTIASEIGNHSLPLGAKENEDDSSADEQSEAGIIAPGRRDTLLEPPPGQSMQSDIQSEETGSLDPGSVSEHADGSTFETEYPTVVPPASEREKSPAPFAGFLAELGNEPEQGTDLAQASQDIATGSEPESLPTKTVTLAHTPDTEDESTQEEEDPQSNAPTKPPRPVSSAYQRNRQAQVTDELPGRSRRMQSNGYNPAPKDPASSGELKLGAYRIIGELGSGGMAVIYKAVQTAVDRMVAIKELRPELISDTEVMARFEREATSMASLQHGNIVQIYDFVQDFDSAYIVMEYVEGTDLFDVLAHCQKIPPDVVAIIGFKIASALEYAHYRGIIHRDIKPSNVLMSNQGEIKLLDFGIARDPGRSNITQIGMALGTPAYMSPEQIRGEQIDFRADIFSLGVCLYEFLAGEKPWQDDGTQEVARKILIEPPRPLRQFCPDISFEMEKIIARCLAKDAEQRFATTFELTRALQSVVVRDLDINTRQRLVVFLNNRQMVAAERAASLVDDQTLAHPGLRRRDLGLPVPSSDPMFRKVFMACGITVMAIFAVAFLSNLLPWGEDIADTPSAVAIETPAIARERLAAKPEPKAQEVTKSKAEPEPKSKTASRVVKPPTKRRASRATVPGTIKITGSKKWYDVYIDGRKLYRHPKRGRPLAPGRYMVQLKNPTCRTIKKRIQIRSKQTTVIRASCRPKR